MFRETTSVGVVEHGLGGALKHLLDGVEAVGDIDRLDVGLAARKGVCERARPHPVEGAGWTEFGLLLGVLDDEPGEAVVRLQEAQEGLGGKKAPEHVAPTVGRDAEFAETLVERGGADALGVLRLDELATPFGDDVDDVLARLLLNALAPVTAVDDEVGLEGAEVGLVVKRRLRHGARNVLDGIDDGPALLKRHVGKALVAGDGRVGEDAHDNLAMLGGDLEDVEVPGMDEVGAHANVDEGAGAGGVEGVHGWERFVKGCGRRFREGIAHGWGRR